ncbi:MAG: ABC transporter permease [Thiovulaceae bacterium]|nr:ABC transporter permease [Sulfurimonadaceae bacterium]
MNHLANIFRLGIKELRSLWHDKVMMIMIAYSFTIAIYVGATATSTELHNAPIGFVDEDHSALSHKIIEDFYPPRFGIPQIISWTQVDTDLDAGLYTFVIVIPNNFEKDILSKRNPDIQVNIDATRMTQAGIGAGYIQQIINNEVSEYFSKGKTTQTLPINMLIRMKYNPNLTSSWFGGVMEMISMISLLSIVLTGAALIREREHGTLEHLMVMPLTASEIILAKVWSMGLVVLVSAAFALIVVIEGVLQVPVTGSELLFLLTALLTLFATTSMGIFMGTIARTMPQLGLIFILTILPLQILSGGITPFESMPQVLQNIMFFTPTSHFVNIAQAILYRGAGLSVIWPHMLAIIGIGLAFFFLALLMFRRSLASST